MMVIIVIIVFIILLFPLVEHDARFNALETDGERPREQTSVEATAGGGGEGCCSLWPCCRDKDLVVTRRRIGAC